MTPAELQPYVDLIEADVARAVKNIIGTPVSDVERAVRDNFPFSVGESVRYGSRDFVIENIKVGAVRGDPTSVNCQIEVRPIPPLTRATFPFDLPTFVDPAGAWS
jgi:hypothetical protein